MRGRLIHKQIVEIAMLDAVHTRADDPDGSGSLTSGYDDDFDEVLVFTKNGTRQEARKDQDPIFLPCNVVTESWDALQQLMAGNSPMSKIEIVAHRSAFECAGLLDCVTGRPLIRVNDKMLTIRDRCRRVVYAPDRPLYVTQVAPIFGIGEAPDLFQITCEDREDFAKSGG